MQIGVITLQNNLFVAPMAGVTDRPFRSLCKKLGAGYAVSEMVTSKRELWESKKTRLRADHTGETGPIAVQITGTSPAEMAQAALYNINCGAQIIDINMGCPVKKVCKKWAGSALMQDEALALLIIEAVVNACTPYHVPVTLKIRTGWDAAHKNAPSIALAAQEAGIALITIHGRTREQKYHGEAEYDTIAYIKSLLNIPVVANGDIDSAAKAKFVLNKTKADALMIGRAAQHKPWLFKEIDYFLQTGEILPSPLTQDILCWITEYLEEHYIFYGEFSGVRQARKHIAWLIQKHPEADTMLQKVNQAESAKSQLCLVHDYFQKLEQNYERWPF